MERVKDRSNWREVPNTSYYRRQEAMETCCCYPKDQVYPASGGEFQLEQLRAVLPQYKVTLPIAEDDSCDMEMTVAYTANISTMIPSSGTREYDEGFSRML